MKKIFSALLLTITTTTIPLNAQADCINAYETKAQQRAELKYILNTTGVVTAAVAIAAAGAIVSPIVFLPIAGSIDAKFLIVAGFLGGPAIGGNILEHALPHKNNNNQFFKALAALEGAKNGMVSTDMLARINKKIDLKSYSDEQQAKAAEIIVKTLNDGNSNETYCPMNDKGKIKVMKYNKMIDQVVANIITQL
jgi:hypothetical protein